MLTSDKDKKNVVINYRLNFINMDRKKFEVDILISNYQVAVYYNGYWDKCALYRVVNDEEHEVISLISHYVGMGYRLIKFERNRIASKDYFGQ